MSDVGATTNDSIAGALPPDPPEEAVEELDAGPALDVEAAPPADALELDETATSELEIGPAA